MGQLACVLWDFGGTIADETFAWQGPPGVDAWRALGGLAYLFTTEARFVADLGAAPLTRLVTPPR